jgi:hypothetical protein
VWTISNIISGINCPGLLQTKNTSRAFVTRFFHRFRTIRRPRCQSQAKSLLVTRTSLATALPKINTPEFSKAL